MDCDEIANAWSGLLPKEETQAHAFIKENPTWDGRGIIVGVLDTGVDPGALGLQRTTDGKVKVLDVIDCTGSGDVSLGVPVRADSEGLLPIGPSGRRIRINPAWHNPTGQYRVGMKRLFELYPGGLKARVVEQLRKKWDTLQAQAEHALQVAIAAANSSSFTPSSTDEGSGATDVEVGVKEEMPRVEVADLRLRLAALRSMGSDGVGLGGAGGGGDPLVDCLAFHDGTSWRSCFLADVDAQLASLERLAAASADPSATVRTGAGAGGEVDANDVSDMSCLEALGPYREAQQFRRLSSLDALNCCAEVYDDGETLSLCVDSGAHGTHVAGIIAAHHPDQPECNGVAPGAQIVSLKIGDSRLGSMETGVGFTRALIEAVRRGCNIINMSFGEACTVNDVGEFVRLAEEVVSTHNILFVGSAGNNGPCISTVGAPCGTSSSVLSVGALATRSLMRAAYSMLEQVPATNYTWSSVGPTTDGACGVSIVAPGGAITCVPNWTLNKKQLMNGTSMSSPNACGCIALLMSASKQLQHEAVGASMDSAGAGAAASGGASANVGGASKAPLVTSAGTLSAARYRLAVENSAALQPGVHVLGQRHGLVQVQAAWRHLQQNLHDASIDLPLRVRVAGDVRFSRGIYLRQPAEIVATSTHSIEVRPQFREDAQPEDKFNFEMRLSLRSSAAWLRCPDRVELLQGGKVFSVQLDPCALPEGLHVASVTAFDEANPHKGAVFELPVTVIVPLVVGSGGSGGGNVDDADAMELTLPTVTLHPCERVRKFIVPPLGCTGIEATVFDRRAASSATEGAAEGGASLDGAAKLVAFHAVQVFSGVPYRDNEKQTYLRLTPQSQHTFSWPVTAGATMELCLARFWSTLGAAEAVQCEVRLRFHGLCVRPAELTVFGGRRISEPILLHNPLRSAEISPVAKLDSLQTVVAASSRAVVRPLGERDFLPGGAPLYSLELQYSFELSSAAAATLSSVTPRWPLLNGILYESPLHAQFHQLLCARTHRVLACGDAWPDAIPVIKGDSSGAAASKRYPGIPASGGKFIVRLQLRHRDCSALEGMHSLPMLLDKKLKSPLKLACRRSQVDVINEAGETDFMLQRGVFQRVYLCEPSTEQLPKGCSAGDVLAGSATFLKKGGGDSASGGTDGCLKAACPLRFVVNPSKDPPKETKETSTAAQASSSEQKGRDGKGSSKEAPSAAQAVQEAQTEEEAKAAEALRVALRDARLKALESLAGSTARTGTGQLLFDAHLAPLIAEEQEQCGVLGRAAHLPLHGLRLKHAVARADTAVQAAAAAALVSASSSKSPLEEGDGKTGGVDAPLLPLLDAVLEVADEIATQRIDSAGVAAELGQLVDKDSAPLVAARKEVEARKELLVKALTAKCRALMQKHTLLLPPRTKGTRDTNGESEGSAGDQCSEAGPDLDAFEAAYGALRRWVDVGKSEQHWELFVYHCKLQNRLGAAIQRVNELISSSSSGSGQLVGAQQELLRLLGWRHILDRARSHTFLATAAAAFPAL